MNFKNVVKRSLKSLLSSSPSGHCSFKVQAFEYEIKETADENKVFLLMEKGWLVMLTMTKMMMVLMSVLIFKHSLR